MSLMPPFNRQGNKFYIRNKIIERIPEHDTYIEPFAGSASIFFNKEKAKKNILNDLDEALINRLKLLKKASTNIKKYNQNLKTIDDLKEFFDKPDKTKEDELLLEKIKLSTGYCANPIAKSKQIYRAHNPATMILKLPEYQKLLKHVKLYSKDYKFIIKKFDSPTSFFFIDPPYEKTDASFGYAEGSTKFNFEELRDTLNDIQGHFLLTINDSPLIRSLFKEFEITPVDIVNNWQNCASTPQKKHRKELFITNYFS